jgi:hypothetical protein
MASNWQCTNQVATFNQLKNETGQIRLIATLSTEIPINRNISMSPEITIDYTKNVECYIKYRIPLHFG